MQRSHRLEPAVLALPGVTLGAAGLLHPHHLSYGTADTWFGLHLAGLLVFPLVGVAAFRLVRGRRDPVAWLVRLTAYVYATLYTALDVISGIAAGWVTRRIGPGVPRPEEVSLLFRIGTPIGEVGSAALIVLALALVADRLLRRTPTAALALPFVLGAWLVHLDHIFAPKGALGMLLIGLSTAALAAIPTRDRGSDATDRA